jgi:hypothetical protein
LMSQSPRVVKDDRRDVEVDDLTIKAIDIGVCAQFGYTIIAYSTKGRAEPGAEGQQRELK